jgi:hypothetical protein
VIYENHASNQGQSRHGIVLRMSPINGFPPNVRVSRAGHQNDSVSTSPHVFRLLKDREMCFREGSHCWVASGRGMVPIQLDVKTTRSNLGVTMNEGIPVQKRQRTTDTDAMICIHEPSRSTYCYQD